MAGPNLIRQARTAVRRTQTDLAAASGTSQATLSAYERGTKSPTLTVAERIIEATGHTLTLTPQVAFHQIAGEYGLGPFWLADRLWQLPPGLAFREVILPWRITGLVRRLHLHTRDDRALAYAALLIHGEPTELLDLIDGNLLIDIFDELDLPDPIRRAWLPFIQAARRPMPNFTLE